MNYKEVIESRYNRQNWLSLLHDIFGSKASFWQTPSIVSTSSPFARQALWLGTITLSDEQTISVYEVELADSVDMERNRRGIRDMLLTDWRNNGNAGAFMFCYRKNESVLRFSYVSEAWKFAEDGTYQKESTDTKRFTYLLGEGHRSRTAIQQFEKLKASELSLKDLTKAFSVDAVSDMFFNGYKKQYEDIIFYVTGKKMVKVANKWEERLEGSPNAFILQQFARFENPEKAVRDYVKKLMGRLVFLQFLQKKGWLGVPVNKEWGEGDSEFVQNLFENCKDKDNFIDNVLEPLFNDLNSERTNDIVSPAVGRNIRVPYLNGGLFEREDTDETQFPLPAKYMQSLLDFFASYNFTIDENDPDDAEVGVNPEMLGRIFENLLEDNKDKGAFYTPKEIVSYMCRESLIAYLQTDIEDEATREALRQFVTTHDISTLGTNDKFHLQADEALKSVKICDPTIGSGAFPMGLLKELFLCRTALEGIEQSKAAEIKKHIIQQNIYGVDIERGAVDIARLRFWLSLIVDEDTPQALPNLDFKIMQGNSLLEQYKGVDLSTVTKLKIEQQGTYQTTMFDDVIDVLRLDLRKMLAEYYNCTGHKEKQALRAKIIENVKQQLREQSINVDFGNLDLSGNDQFMLWHTWFYDVFSQGGFDIVIGNPPYNELRDIGKLEQEALKKSIYYKDAKGGRLNIFQFFYPLGIDVIRDNGILSMITQNSILAEDSTLGNRKLFIEHTDIIAIDSFPERDNKKTRVFESVKMSVCICTLIKKHNPTKDIVIPITVWHTKYMNDCHKLNIKKQEVIDIYPDDYILPISNNEKFEIIKKLLHQKDYSIIASAGEIDMTKYKAFFNVVGKGNRVLTGAQILRYSITNNPSQGDVVYLEQKYQDFSAKRLEEIKSPRIVMQRITGVDSKVRLIATYIDNYFLCANSTNYISVNDVDAFYLLGVLNSKLINFFIKQTSTNTNITSKVIASFPIITRNINVQNDISSIVKEILKAKTNVISIDYQNKENEIDCLVYHLYNLTYSEVLVVDPETSITKKEYESY